MPLALRVSVAATSGGTARQGERCMGGRCLPGARWARWARSEGGEGERGCQAPRLRGTPASPRHAMPPRCGRHRLAQAQRLTGRHIQPALHPAPPMPFRPALTTKSTLHARPARARALPAHGRPPTHSSSAARPPTHPHPSRPTLHAARQVLVGCRQRHSHADRHHLVLRPARGPAGRQHHAHCVVAVRPGARGVAVQVEP